MGSSALLQSSRAATSADVTAGQCPATCSKSLSGFSGKEQHRPTGLATISPDLSPHRAVVGRSGQKGREHQNPSTILAQLRNAFMDEWNNISMRTVNGKLYSKKDKGRSGGVGGPY